MSDWGAASSFWPVRPWIVDVKMWPEGVLYAANPYDLIVSKSTVLPPPAPIWTLWFLVIAPTMRGIEIGRNECEICYFIARMKSC